MSFHSRFRTALLLAIIVTGIVIAALLIILPGPGSETSSFYSNWTIGIAAITAWSLSCLSTVKAFRTNKFLSNGNNIHEDMDIDIHKSDEAYSIERAKRHFYSCLALTMGLTLWMLAELTWTYYQIGLHIDNPFPSYADSLWLAGYPFIIYFTYGMNKALSKGGLYDREAMILISVSAGLTLAYIFNLTFGVADIMSAAEGELGWLINILYPILDTIALIPSLLIMVSLRASKYTSDSSIHLLLLSSSIIIVTVADIGFGYSEVLGKSKEQQWFWDTLYSTSYIIMAGALYAYYTLLSLNKHEIPFTDLKYTTPRVKHASHN